MVIQNTGLEGIKLGRGHECEIRITDISVSRNHASIKITDDGFFIYDNKSKFGTLVRDENTLVMDVGEVERSVQIGRTLVEMVVAKKKI
jgi:pSer/pThr/pTyr-binding forkhead associated (FHA) protein